MGRQLSRIIGQRDGSTLLSRLIARIQDLRKKANQYEAISEADLDVIVTRLQGSALQIIGRWRPLSNYIKKGAHPNS